MFKRITHEPQHVVVRQPEVHVPTLAAAAHKLDPLKELHAMRDGGERLVQRRRDLGSTRFSLAQELQGPQPLLVAQRLEELNRSPEGSIRKG